MMRFLDMFRRKKVEPIDKNSIAVILVDMQEEFVESLREGEAKRIIPNQLAVLRYCNRFEIPVIILELDAHKFGKTIKILMRQGRKKSNFYLIEKGHNSGFYRTCLNDLLKGLGVEKLLIIGINADYCVMETAEDAIKNGYGIVTSNDLISGSSWHSLNNSVPWFKKNGNYVHSLKELACLVQ